MYKTEGDLAIREVFRKDNKIVNKFSNYSFRLNKSLKNCFISFLEDS